jgi:hypothetical protein
MHQRNSQATNQHACAAAQHDCCCLIQRTLVSPSVGRLQASPCDFQSLVVSTSSGASMSSGALSCMVRMERNCRAEANRPAQANQLLAEDFVPDAGMTKAIA